MSWPKAVPQLLWLRLHFGSSLDADAVRAFLLNVLTDHHLGVVVFEVESNRTETVWRIGCANQRALLRLVKTHLRDLTLAKWQRHVASELVAWRLSACTSAVSLNSDDAESSTAALLGALAVSGNARTIHQVVIGQRLDPQTVPQQMIGHPGASVAQQFVSAMWHGARPIETDTRRALIAKRSMPGAVVTVRLGVTDPDNSYQRLPGGYVATWRSLATPGLRFSLNQDRTERVDRGVSAPRQALRLNIDEVLAVLAWPYGDRPYPRMDRDRSVTLPVTGSANGGKLIGLSTHPGQNKRELRLSSEASLRHGVIVGPTGVGKSTLLGSMVLADIAANRSVVVIDPKADLVDDLLARIPDQHLERTVLLDPSRTDKTVGFNPLAIAARERHQAVDGLVHVFKTLHAKSWGPRSEDILHACLLTLTFTGQPSLTDIPGLLTNNPTRHSLLSQLSLPEPLVSFWEWFEAMSPGERSHVCAPLLNKLRPFTLRPSLAATLNAADPFKVSRVFTERLVLLVPLRKGRIGSEAAHLFGSMLVSELWRTIQTRVSISRDRRHASFVYADEFQDYLALPTDFGDVLTQSRGLGVGWTVAHQNFDQLPTQLGRAVAANAQNKIFFRLSADDARRAARDVEELRPTDLARLPAFEAYAQVLQHGELMPFASIRTQPLPAPLRNHRRAATQLVNKWGCPVTTEPAAGLSEDPAPIGRRKRSRS